MRWHAWQMQMRSRHDSACHALAAQMITLARQCGIQTLMPYNWHMLVLALCIRRTPQAVSLLKHISCGEAGLRG